MIFTSGKVCFGNRFFSIITVHRRNSDFSFKEDKHLLSLSLSELKSLIFSLDFDPGSFSC